MGDERLGPAIRVVVERFGEEVFAQPDRLRALLTDELGSSGVRLPAEVEVIVRVATPQVVRSLGSEDDLEQAQALTSERIDDAHEAQWVLDTLRQALIPDVVPSEPTPTADSPPLADDGPRVRAWPDPDASDHGDVKPPGRTDAESGSPSSDHDTDDSAGTQGSSERARRPRRWFESRWVLAGATFALVALVAVVAGLRDPVIGFANDVSPLPLESCNSYSHGSGEGLPDDFASCLVVGTDVVVRIARSSEQYDLLWDWGVSDASLTRPSECRQPVEEVQAGTVGSRQFVCAWLRGDDDNRHSSILLMWHDPDAGTVFRVSDIPETDEVPARWSQLYDVFSRIVDASLGGELAATGPDRGGSDG